MVNCGLEKECIRKQLCEYCSRNPSCTFEIKKDHFKTKNKNVIRRRNTSKSAERSLALRLHGQRQPLSGALDKVAGLTGFAGDVKTDDLLIEHKMRSSVDKDGNKFISIKKEWIDQIVEQTEKLNSVTNDNKKPAVVFKYTYSKDSYIIFREIDFPDKDISIFNVEASKKSISIKEKEIKDILKLNTVMSFSFKDDDKIYYVLNLNYWINNFRGK